MKIQEYDNEDPCIDTGWLRSQLVMTRSQINHRAGNRIDDTAWEQWRLTAGMFQSDRTGQPRKKANGQLVGTKAKTCTKQQAALIVLLALWKPANKPYLKRILGSDLNAGQLNALSVRRLFNEWDQVNGCEEAAQLLGNIQRCRDLTPQDLSNLSEALTGKSIPIQTIERRLRTRGTTRISRRKIRRTIQKMLNPRERKTSWRSEGPYQARLTGR